MSTSPVASAGSACSGSASKSSQRRLGAVSASASIAGRTIRSATDWKVAIRTRPPTVPDAAARSASARAARSSSASACSTSDARRVGQAHAAAGALEQAHAGLAFEQRELLGDGARRELERVGDRGDRAAVVELFEQPEAAQLEHSVAMLLVLR